MSAKVISDRMVTARKAHDCNACALAAIQPGDKYRREVYAYDGHAYTWKLCSPCSKIASAVYRWVDPPWDEGIDRDSYWEWARDHADDPEHSSSARAYLNRVRDLPEGENTR